MNIKEKLEKIKGTENNIILVLVVIFTALIAFGLGRLSVITEKKTPVVVESLSAGTIMSTTLTSDIGEKLYVVSKNGARYHYPWCSGAQSIKEENKIWFDTKEEAEAAGYTPAANCKGL